LPIYHELKDEFDPHVRQGIATKENIIVEAPYSSPMLKHELNGIRRFKSGKIRILYALSTEKPIFWESPPTPPEVIFLYVDMRKDETYKEAYKCLNKYL